MGYYKYIMLPAQEATPESNGKASFSQKSENLAFSKGYSQSSVASRGSESKLLVLAARSPIKTGCVQVRDETNLKAISLKGAQLRVKHPASLLNHFEKLGRKIRLTCLCSSCYPSLYP